MVMIKRLVRMSLLTLVLVGMAAGAFAQGPLQKQVYFTINAPYQLRMANYFLSPGRYTLFQISQSNSNLFALYMGDRTHSPIAMIMTIRRPFGPGQFPDKTMMDWEYNESTSSTHPVVNGWMIAGEDGWEIISVVPTRHGQYLTRIE